MARQITEQELRSESSEIVRALGRGEAFVVTRCGVPVGELLPVRARYFVAADATLVAFAGAAATAADGFRAEVDAPLAQDPTPRA